MMRTLIVLFVPGVALGSGGIYDVGPLFGGPRAFAIVNVRDYPRGQEVLLEIHATADLPGAEKVFLGQSKTVVAGPGGVFIDLSQVAILISDPLPETGKEWKIQYWYSPSARSPRDHTTTEWTAPRKVPRRK